MFIRDVMSTDAKCCVASDTADRAARLMWKHDIGAIPVVDDSGRPIAMITDRDIAMAAHHGRRRLDQIAVRDCMSRQLWACAPDDAIAQVERLMADRQVHRLPVVEKGKLAGVVTLNDIARAAGPKAPQAEANALMSTLMSITEPRRARVAEA